MNKPSIYFLDSNILLLDANNIVQLAAQADFIGISEVVVEECDKFKGEFTERGFQARSVGRMLQQSSIVKVNTEKEYVKTELCTAEGISILIINKNEYTTSPGTTSYNDKRIIETAKTLQSDYDVTFVTNDTLARVHALTFDIPVTDLKNVETTDLEFTKTLQVDSTVFSTLHNSKIAEVDQDYKPENYNYIFVDSYSGQVKLANITQAGLITVLGKDTENELAKQDATPMNSGQRFLSRAIQNQLVDIVVCEALAGSGFN